MARMSFCGILLIKLYSKATASPYSNQEVILYIAILYSYLSIIGVKITVYYFI